MEDLPILNINDQIRILKDHVLDITKNIYQFATHLEKSDSERQKLKNEIIANVEQIHNNYEPHMPRNSTPLTEEKLSVKESLTPVLGENVISQKIFPNWKNGQHSPVKESTTILSSSELLICFKNIFTYLMKL
ncbi:hypothetical protein O181_049996 [Austropuccinia psidii MF-1]|uniref:Uncharacterized protein n=1 Tax=Austropuccinia psidii MF-1 TaxID=1389203 RepID=A0A9Q3HLY1_9BASI|nr:hypothetical protein [Austropuccinia psidii MF-1]